MLNGTSTFSEIDVRCPEISPTLLTTRLRELQRADVVSATPKAAGRGVRYHFGAARRDPGDVILHPWAATSGCSSPLTRRTTRSNFS